jgi:hypothetical protein
MGRKAPKTPPNPPYRNIRVAGTKAQRYEYMAPTADDWCPNFAGDEVRVTAVELVSTTGDINFVRVHVWGADDLGMEKDWPIEMMPFELAVIIADGLPKPIRKEDLTLLGFVYT